MELIRLIDCRPDDRVRRLVGHFADARHYRRIVEEDARVVRPDGTVLAVYVRSALSSSACRLAYETLRDVPLSYGSDNRATAAGVLSERDIPAGAIVMSGGLQYSPLRQRGYVSQTRYAKHLASAAIGFLPPSSRSPVCRASRYIIAFSTTKSLERLRASNQYATLWKVLVSTIRWLGGATAASLIALIVDRPAKPAPFVMHAALVAVSVAATSVARTAWVLENIIGIVIKHTSKK